LDRWIKAWRTGGFEALKPKDRAVQARTPCEVLDLAASLKREKPERTCAQVRRIVERMVGHAPSESTLLRHFRRLGLPQVHRQVTGRFQADFVNEIWVGDALHGPKVDGRKTYLFAFLDDYSRYVVAARWAFAEDTARMALALRPALLAWGVPNSTYLDNGAAMKDKQLARACARLGIRLIHSKPGRPQGRGKIERFFNTVTSQFLCEIADLDISPDAPGTKVTTLEEFNDLFKAWLEVSYHQTVNDTTGQTPASRWQEGRAITVVRPAQPEQVAEAFLWSETRTVSTSGTIKMFNNLYQSDPLWAGRKIEAVYDPFDLSRLVDVVYQGHSAGPAQQIQIRRHVAPKAVNAAKDEHLTQTSTATGVDYLALLKDDHDTHATRAGVDYRALSTQPPAAPTPRPEEQQRLW